MSAAEFDEATPLEVQWRVDALRDEHTRELRNTAQLAAWVLSMFSKEPVIVSDLVKIKGDDEKLQKFDWSAWMRG